jgi:RES domain-containing protein
MGRAWRICMAARAPDGATAFSGLGAQLHGGRWNSKGVAVAYGSETLSLCALEYLVHAAEPLLAGARLVACPVEWPAEVSTEVAPAAVRVAGWRRSPPPRALQAFGDAWVASRRSAILYVPSAIIPAERNVLLNPAHPDAGRLIYGVPEPFAFDPRLL